MIEFVSMTNNGSQFNKVSPMLYNSCIPRFAFQIKFLSSYSSKFVIRVLKFNFNRIKYVIKLASFAEQFQIKKIFPKKEMQCTPQSVISNRRFQIKMHIVVAIARRNTLILVHITFLSHFNHLSSQCLPCMV